jgi:hypothetical protein
MVQKWRFLCASSLDKADSKLTNNIIWCENK